MSTLYLDLSQLEMTLIPSGSLKLMVVSLLLTADNEVAKRVHTIEMKN